MAGFFDNLKKGLDKGTKMVSAKSSQVIETNKVKSEIAALKKSKAEAITTIGTKVYEAKEAFTYDLVAEEVEAISGYEVAIEEKEAELERIRIETETKMNEIKAETEAVTEDEVDGAVEVDIEVQDHVEEDK